MALPYNLRLRGLFKRVGAGEHQIKQRNGMKRVSNLVVQQFRLVERLEVWPLSKAALSIALLVAILILSDLWMSVGSAYANENVHVVEPGETLSEIAVTYGVDVETLRSLNNLSDIDLVWVGLPLTLPMALGSAEGTSAEALIIEDSAADIGPANYTAQTGDTLSSIAAAHGMSLAQLVELNRISLSRPLYVGEVLSLRAMETASIIDVADNFQEERVHVVQAGEHLGIIAEAYTTSARKIAEVNTLSNASLLVPGQTLRIPPPSFDELAKLSPVGDDGYHTHPVALSETEKWIDVDLSEQRVVAYEGAEPVAEFAVSTGKQATPTVTGTFRIWAKTPVQDMFGGNRAAGDFYFLEDVQWVQYFHEDYGFHGATWHNNFGQPMSRGCVNMRNEDAEWLYKWAGPDGAEVDKNGWVVINAVHPGTLVVVHE